MASKGKQPKRVALADDRLETHQVDETGKKIIAMLTALENEDQMSDWERGFVADMIDRFHGKEQTLTQGQYDKLESIYRKWN